MRRHEPYPSPETKEVILCGRQWRRLPQLTMRPCRTARLSPVIDTDAYPKPVIVNVTNADILYGMAGTDDDGFAWPNRRALCR